MRDLLTIFLTAAGGATGYVIGEGGLGATLGCLGGVCTDIAIKGYLIHADDKNRQPR